LYVVLNHILLLNKSYCIVDWYLNLPPSELKAAELELRETRLALCKVKSIQVEFVKHSKLSRKALKIEKDIEKMKESKVPQIARVKNMLGYVKIVSFCIVGVLISQHQKEVIFVPSSMIWPFSLLLFLPSGFNIHPVFLLFIAAQSWQYVFATLLSTA